MSSKRLGSTGVLVHGIQNKQIYSFQITVLEKKNFSSFLYLHIPTFFVFNQGKM